MRVVSNSDYSGNTSRARLGLVSGSSSDQWQGALVSLSVNDGGHLGYATASNPREDGIMSVPHLVGHTPMTIKGLCLGALVWSSL
jgi:hypothetical protein